MLCYIGNFRNEDWKKKREKYVFLQIVSRAWLEERVGDGMGVCQDTFVQVLLGLSVWTFSLLVQGRTPVTRRSSGEQGRKRPESDLPMVNGLLHGRENEGNFNFYVLPSGSEIFLLLLFPQMPRYHIKVVCLEACFSCFYVLMKHTLFRICYSPSCTKQPQLPAHHIWKTYIWTVKWMREKILLVI